MELSEAGKILNQVAKEREAARCLGDAVAVALEAINGTTKAQLAYKELKSQIEAAKGELSDCKAQHGKQKDKLAKDAAEAVQSLNASLAARQAEAEAALKPVLAKLNEARSANAKEVADHEERIANLSQQEATLSASVKKLTATIDKLKAAVQNV